MNKSKKALVFVLLLLIIAAGTAFFKIYNAQAQTSVISATVTISVCGNSIEEGGEQCDGADLGGETCVSRGFSGGALSCNPDCTFNTSNCTSGGGGGGGGGGSPVLETKVIIQGKAYPDSNVNILKDGKSAGIIKADPQADFKYEFSDITPGIYTFGVWAEDRDGLKSITYTLTFSVSPNTITTVSGIFLPPTIGVDKTNAERGEIINIFGQSVPKTEIGIRVLSSEIIEKTTSDEIGAWLLKFNTQFLEEGHHTAAAQSWLNSNEKSGFGKTLSFNIGETIVTVAKGEEASDFNRDGKVNLVDFSIFLSWFGKENPDYDLNNNGKVDLADFSIFLCYWTG